MLEEIPQEEHTSPPCPLISSKEAEKSSDLKRLENERAKLTEAVSKLTQDPKRKVDHKTALEGAAKRLNLARISSSKHQDALDIDVVKKMLNDCQTEDEMFKVLWLNPQFQSKFSSLFSSKLLEQLMALGSLSGNPLNTFPVDINTNVYVDVIHFALDNAKDVVLLLAALTRKHETPISAKDVIELAFFFSTLAESVSIHNKALKKIKSISMRSSGLTNAGLDSLSAVGVAETSRTFRNDRDLLASISEEIVKQYAKNQTAQFTFDNLDICINKIQHHLTLNFLEFEKKDTSKLRTDSKTRDEMLVFFSLETLLLKSKENEEMFEHFQYVTACTLARLFGKEIAGMEWLRSAFPDHYQHKNSATAAQKSLMHVEKPMYLQETKNSDMFKIMENLQLDYLNLVGEQADEKEKYFEDLRMILSMDCERSVREAAELRVKEQVLSVGEMICHGDQLTNERFDSCKRLKQGSTTAFERFEFMPIFR